MKTILCFGDSNTYGYNPAGGRFGLHERWAGVLRDELKEGYWVIEEGLNGRTTVWDDPIEGKHKNGREYLLPCLESHAPIDLVVILLGTNDLKMRFGLPAQDVARGAGVLVNLVKASSAGPESTAPQVLLIAPPPFAPLTHFGEMFAGGFEKSREIGKYYRQWADLLNCHFLDAGEVIVSSSLDGIHWELGEHRKLGKAVSGWVKEILS